MKMPKEVSKNLSEIMSVLTKEFGNDIGRIMDDNKIEEVDVIPTGIETIDKATGIGGIPRGRFTEILGVEGSGKTTLALHIVKEAQKMNLPCVYVDAENALVPERMKQIGVDLGKIIIVQPESGEQGLEVALMVASNKNSGLVVLDSVAMLTPQVEIDKDIGESVMGVHARMMRQGIRKITHPASKNKVAVVCINQVTSKIGAYGGGDTTPGGSALRFASSMRIKTKLVGQIKDSAGNKIGDNFKLTCIKNKFGVPFKTADFEIGEEGIDDTKFLIKKLVDDGIISKAGSWFSFDGKQLAQGERGVAALVKKDPELRARLFNGYTAKEDTNEQIIE